MAIDKRAAIARVLADYLPADVVQRALGIWDRKYAGGAGFALQNFVSEFDDRSVQGLRGALTRDLTRALLMPEQRDIAVVPVALRESSNQPGYDVPQAFCWLVNYLAHMLGEPQRQLFYHKLRYEFNEFNLDTLQKAVLDDFFDQHRVVPAHVTLESRMLHQVIRKAYVIIAQLQGTTKTDLWFSRALQQAERVGYYDVRRLL